MQRLAWLVVALSTWAASPAGQPSPPPTRSQLVVVLDGLRPDYVTAAVMPRLTAFAARGTTFRAHHSVYPTVTRVNVASMVTGRYPEAHGLLGNTIYVPAVNAVKGLDTGSRENLEAVAKADGPLLTAPTLGELLQRAGKKLLAVGSGSSGAVFLLNHTVAGGAIIHQEFTRPATLAARVVERLGPPPAHALPNEELNRRAVDAYLTIGRDDIRPDVTLMWISDPDTTAHTHGMGSETTERSLSLADAEFGRIEDALRQKGLLDRTNVIVVSDHGFSAYTNTLRLASLVERFARRLPDGSPDIVVAEGAVYFRGGRDPERVAAVVAALQRQPEVGAIFTAGRGMAGDVAGTLSYDVVHWKHARSGDMLVAPNWSDGTAGSKFPGTSTQVGTAGHGTSSPYDIHATLIAAGPDFRERTVSDVPTGNVDLTPTLLRLVGIEPPPDMAGRVIAEGLRSGPAPASIAIERSTETVKSPDGTYQLTAHFSKAAGRTYLDFTDVVRR